MQIIKLTNIHFSYAKNKDILNDISFTVKKGEVIGIVGHTGCGKSSLLQLIAQVYKPSSGSLIINGRVGIVFQFPERQLFAHTVYDELAFGLINLGIDKQTTTRKIKDTLELFNFDFNAIKDESPFAFSGGQKRKLAIASIICCEPEILLLDEPTSGLDYDGIKQLLKLLKLLQHKTTIVIVSHNNDFLAETCTRILALEDGKIISDLPTNEHFYNVAFLKQHNLNTCSVSEICLKLSQLKKISLSKTVCYNELLNELVKNFYKEK